MFNFFKKKPSTGPIFNVLDESTWDWASDSIFILNSKTFHMGGDNAEKFTEKKMVKAIDDVIRGISNADEAKGKIQKIGRKKVIERIINNMAHGMAFTESIDEMIHWINMPSVDEAEIFEIFDIDTWDYATQRPFFWKDKMLFSAEDGKAITEKNLVDLFRAMFKFLERQGDKLSLTQRTQGITHILDRMAIYQSNPVIMKDLEKDNNSINHTVDTIKKQKEADAAIHHRKDLEATRLAYEYAHKEWDLAGKSKKNRGIDIEFFDRLRELYLENCKNLSIEPNKGAFSQEARDHFLKKQ
jgi:hypothetical protein